MKIYIHHQYTYELFWYFFHASIPVETIPTWFPQNQFDKTKPIDDIVTINTTYNDVLFECVFCNENLWDTLDGYHIWDYTIYHYENKNVSDRGWNLILGEDLKDVIIPKLNKHASKLRSKLSIFFIDWEVGDNHIIKDLNKLLNSDIILFKDELTNIVGNQRVSLTHILWSFIYPNTINLRDYYFFADYLKYKDDYKFKINYPIRRITDFKYKVANYIIEKLNPLFNITLSTFTNYITDTERTSDVKKKLFTDLCSKIGEDNLIKKRGYNFNDWGGEYNDDNMSEFMWKLMTISEVNLIHEYSSGYSINEKSFMHILANKPFVPTSKGTFKFYNEILKSYEIPTKLFLLDDMNLTERIDYLNEISKDDLKWNIFMGELKDYINYYRSSLLNIINHNNGYLDSLIERNYTKQSII